MTLGQLTTLVSGWPLGTTGYLIHAWSIHFRDKDCNRNTKISFYQVNYLWALTTWITMGGILFSNLAEV